MVTYYQPYRLLDRKDPTRMELAARFHAAEPVVLGIVDNNKPRAGHLLHLLCEELSHHIPVADILTHKKPTAGRPIDDAPARELAKQVDLVVAGVGD